MRERRAEGPRGATTAARRIAPGLLLGLLSVAPARAAEPAATAQLYAAQCAFCHGVKGAGDGMAAAMLQPPPTNFAAPGYWQKADRESLRKTIREGRAGTAMAPFGALTKEQIEALLSYLEGLGSGG